eukprot:5504156-Lingulodinium_polyedra.AAC.1
MGWAAAGRTRRPSGAPRPWAASSHSGAADSQGATRAPARKGQRRLAAAAARAPGAHARGP